MKSQLPILYRDDHYLAVNKPAGLLVHRSDLDRHETRFALQMARDLVGRHVYPVHRLDRPTSGALLFALSPEAARLAADAFTSGAVRKTYLAVVRGFTEEDALIDYPLRELPDRFEGDGDIDSPGMRSPPSVAWPWSNSRCLWGTIRPPAIRSWKSVPAPAGDTRSVVI